MLLFLSVKVISKKYTFNNPVYMYLFAAIEDDTKNILILYSWHLQDVDFNIIKVNFVCIGFASLHVWKEEEKEKI